jgi:hypothetical protein
MGAGIIIEFKKYDEPDLSVQNYVIRKDIVPKTINLRKDEFNNGKPEIEKGNAFCDRQPDRNE